MIKYRIKADKSQLEEIDSQFFYFAIDDEVWFEDADQTIVTENPLVKKDIEQILTEAGIEFSVEDY